MELGRPKLRAGGRLTNIYAPILESGPDMTPSESGLSSSALILSKTGNDLGLFFRRQEFALLGEVGHDEWCDEGHDNSEDTW